MQNWEVQIVGPTLATLESINQAASMLQRRGQVVWRSLLPHTTENSQPILHH